MKQNDMILQDIAKVNQEEFLNDYLWYLVKNQLYVIK